MRTWVLATPDVETAFLKGLTYKEISDMTGESLRMVYFHLPKGVAAVMRQIPRYKEYDERYHCLRRTRPGNGTQDAPRAFWLKLALVTRSPEIGFVPTTMDKDLELKHEHGQLVALVWKHVGDVKFGAPESRLAW